MKKEDLTRGTAQADDNILDAEIISEISNEELPDGERGSGRFILGGSGHGTTGRTPTGGASAGGDIPPATVRRALWIDLLTIIGVFVIASVLGSFVKGIVTQTAGADPAFGTFMGNGIVYLVTILFAAWIMARRGDRRRPLLGFSFRRCGPTLLLWGLVLVLVTSVVLEPLLQLFPDVNMEIIKQAVGTGGWAIMSVVVLAPLAEEILFRGMIQEAASREYGPLKGILLSAAIFGIIHIIPQQVVNAFFIGIILGYIYFKTGSLIPVIFIHAVNNALAYITMVTFDDYATLSLRDVISNDVWYWVLYGASAVIFLIAGWNLFSQLNKAETASAARKR